MQDKQLYLRKYADEEQQYLNNPANGSCYYVNQHNKEAIIKKLRKNGYQINEITYSGTRIKGLLLHVTALCNLSCVHCYASAYRNKQDPMTLKRIEKILNDAFSMNVTRISMTGGEPFFRKDLKEIVKRIHSYGFHLYPIFTNATLLTRRRGVLNTISNYFDTAFYVSVHGLKRGHDSFVGVPNSFCSTLEGIKCLGEYGFKVVINTNLHKLNIDRLPEMYRLFKDLGIIRWRMSRPYLSGDWNKSHHGLEVTVEEEVNAYDNLLKIYDADGKPFDLDLGYYYRHERGVTLKEEYSPSDLVCEYFRNFIVIYPDGNVSFCPRLDEKKFIAGNVFVLPLAQIVEGQKMHCYKNLTVMRVLEKNPTCRSCKYLARCGTGCRANAYLKRKNFWAVDSEFCEQFEHIDTRHREA